MYFHGNESLIIPSSWYVTVRVSTEDSQNSIVDGYSIESLVKSGFHS